MAQEVTQSSYYQDSNRWIDIHQSVKICLENYIAKALFKGDLKRIIYSVPDYTFRKRTELLDTEKVEELTPTSLDLPYASYYQSSDWEDDDRVAAKQAGQALIGQYDLNVFRNIRSRAVKATYKFQIFFSRRDDVRMAEQILGWEANPKGPTLLYDIKEWRGHKMGIPVFTTIEKVTTTPEWKDTDFLQKSRIFPIEVEMTVRSYQVHINKYNSSICLPVRFPNYADDWDPGDTMYFTERATIEFANKKFDLDMDSSKVKTKEIKDLDKMASLYFEKEGPFSQEELNKFSQSLPSNYTVDVLKGYFTETTEVALNVLRLNSKTTPTEAHIDVKVKPADYKYFDRIRFVVPSHGELEFTDCKISEIVIPNLYPDSEYACVVFTQSIYGNISTYNFTFRTPRDEDSKKVPTPEKINHIPGLIGMEL